MVVIQYYSLPCKREHVQAEAAGRLSGFRVEVVKGNGVTVQSHSMIYSQI